MSDKQKEREKLLKSFSNSNGKKFYLRDLLKPQLLPQTNKTV